MAKQKTLANTLFAMLRFDPIFKNTKSTSKSGKLTDLTNIKVGETVDMMQMAAIVGANLA